MVSESNFRWRLVHDFGNLEATLLCSIEELHGSSHIRKEWGLLLLLRSSSILSSYYYTRHLWKIWKSTYAFLPSERTLSEDIDFGARPELFGLYIGPLLEHGYFEMINLQLFLSTYVEVLIGKLEFVLMYKSSVTSWALAFWVQRSWPAK